jgi:hypothetical protein
VSAVEQVSERLGATGEKGTVAGGTMAYVICLYRSPTRQWRLLDNFAHRAGTG